MKKCAMILLIPVCFLSGCKTTEPSQIVPVKWKEQQAYAAKVKDPRRFGYSIYQTPAGVEYRGGCRLHPNQAKMLPMVAEDPLRPVVMLEGKFGAESPVLLDFTASASWMEFGLAQSIRAVPVSERQALLIKIPGEEIPGCPSVVPTLQLGQIFIENPQVIVRMADGPMGSLARGIADPEIKGVIGWEILEKFEQIHLDYAGRRVALTTTKSAYVPDPSRLIAAIPLVQNAGVCAIRGAVDGKSALILIDPVGDFEAATDGAQAVSSIQMDAGFGFASPGVSASPGGVRIGARLLQNFKITICPQEGMIYFEKPEIGRE
jgi:hypothetical protein